VNLAIDVTLHIPGLPAFLHLFLSNQGKIMATLYQILANETAEAAADADRDAKLDTLILNGQLVLDALKALQATGGLTPAQQATIDQIAALQAAGLATAAADSAKIDAAAAPLVP
jgi:hypothetical protein